MHGKCSDGNHLSLKWYLVFQQTELRFVHSHICISSYQAGHVTHQERGGGSSQYQFTIPLQPVPLTASGARTHLLNTLPKNSAMTVLLRIITLYGMLKSGTANSKRPGWVYILGVRPTGAAAAPPRLVMFAPALPILAWPKTRLCICSPSVLDSSASSSRGMMTAGGRSKPRCASGGCSVYRKKALSNEKLRRTLVNGGMRRPASSNKGRALVSAG